MRISTISSKSHGRITSRYPRSFFCFIATIGSLFSAFALNAVSRNKVHNDDFWRTLHSMYSSGCSESLFVPCPLLLPDKGTRRVPKKLATRRSNSFHVFLDVGCFTTIPLLRTCSFGGRFRCNTSLRMGMVSYLMVFDKYNPFPSKMQTDYSNHLLRISGSVLRSV